MKSFVGLVLAGGGAKGAYQAGALTYLAEIGFQPQIIAGTSIGALNGAVLASNPSFSQGVNYLNQLWDELGDANILRLDAGAVARTLSYVAQITIPNFNKLSVECLQELGVLPDSQTILDPQPIEQFIRKAINLKALRQGRELWITVFPSLKIPTIDRDLLMVGIDIIRAKTGTKAHWLCAQDFENDHLLYNLLLASAAIPFAFPQREVNGQYYIDGGLADNIPFGALAVKGCTHAIIIHLGNGEIWNRHDFPEQTIIEIRPEQKINYSNIPIWGSISTIRDFSAGHITELKQRGYDDARRCIEPIVQSIQTIEQQRQVQESIIHFTNLLLGDRPL